MTSTTFTMRMEPLLKERIQKLADEMDMSSTALVKLVLKSFIASPKLEIDLRDLGWSDTHFSTPVSADDFIAELAK